MIQPPLSLVLKFPLNVWTILFQGVCLSVAVYSSHSPWWLLCRCPPHLWCALCCWTFHRWQMDSSGRSRRACVTFSCPGWGLCNFLQKYCSRATEAYRWKCLWGCVTWEMRVCASLGQVSLAASNTVPVGPQQFSCEEETRTPGEVPWSEIMQCTYDIIRNAHKDLSLCGTKFFFCWNGSSNWGGQLL